MSNPLFPDNFNQGPSPSAPNPNGPADLSAQWPAAAGVAVAAFVAAAVMVVGGKSLAGMVLPGLGAVAYLMMAFRVGGKSGKGLPDYFFLAVCAASLPLFYLATIMSSHLTAGKGELSAVVYSAFGAAFAVTYYAMSYRAVYPPRSEGLDWGLIVPVVLMSALLGLILLALASAAFLRTMSPSTEIPPTLGYTFSSIIFFLDSIIITAAALVRVARTRHPADLVQVIARILLLVAHFSVQFVFRFAGSMDLGKQGPMMISFLPSLFFSLIFAVAFFAAPDPAEN